MIIPPGVDALLATCNLRTEKQRQGCAGFLRWGGNVKDARQEADGTLVIHRSVPQLAQGMGLPAAPTKGAAHQRWRNQVYRWVKYLAPLGLTIEEAPRDARGRGTGILIRIPAGVAQSVRAAES